MADQEHEATSPWKMPLAAWKAVAWRTWQETSSDNIGLIAAGVGFYGFLALVPLLGAMVLSYGLIADPQTVIGDMRQLTSVMPADAAKLIADQLLNVVQASDGKKGFGLLLALGLALFGARNGAGAVITALNVAYEETEKRSFIRVNALALGITAAAVAVALLATVAIAALGHLEDLLPWAPDALVAVGKIVSYLVLLLAAAGAAATLYRYGPSRQQARWAWLTPGSLLAAVGWLLLTLGFGIYVANFGNYNATYGSLSAVVVLLTWLYLSAYLLLLGAELNSELEHQTAKDTTTGASRPLGERGSWVADHVAATPAEGGKAAPALEGPPPPSQAPAIASTFAASRAAARAGQLAGIGKAGLLSSAAATLGLRLLRKHGKGGAGAAVLGAAAAVAWFTRERGAPGAIQAVLFDLDGTLVDSNDFHVQAWDAAFREGGHVVSVGAIRGQIGKGGDMLVPALLPNTTKNQQEALAERQGKIFKSRYRAKVKPFPGATALLQRVHDDGRQVILASSANQGDVDHYRRLLGAEKLVNATTSTDDVSTSKPAGDIFAAALAKAKVDPAAALVIGDTPYDVEAAAKCGIAAVAVRSGGFSEEVLRGSGAIALYDDVAALLGGYAASPITHQA